MKAIGLLGGMSWESSAEYYRLVNVEVHRRLGAHHSARCVLYSVDFAAIEGMQRDDDWDGAGKMLADAARSLENGGAELMVLCTNTMHKVAPAITASIGIPLIHIADPTAAAIRAKGIERVGLLGTRYTMEQDFYRSRLESHGIEVLIPKEPDRTTVHEIIYEELVHGVIRETSRRRYCEAIDRLAERGAGGVIYGCTEITLLVGDTDVGIPSFDTTRLHAVAAVDAALDREP